MSERDRTRNIADRRGVGLTRVAATVAVLVISGLTLPTARTDAALILQESDDGLGLNMSGVFVQRNDGSPRGSGTAGNDGRGISFAGRPSYGGNLYAFSNYTFYGSSFSINEATIAGAGTVIGDLFFSCLLLARDTFPGAGFGSVGVGPFKFSLNTDDPASDGNVYFALGHATNVGLGVPISLETWYLSELQYADWIAAGGNEPGLEARSQGRGSGQVTMVATESLTAQSFVGGTNELTVRSTMGFGSGSDHFYLFADEVRYGTTLSDVLDTSQVPEPTAMGLLLTAALAMRRRAASR